MHPNYTQSMVHRMYRSQHTLLSVRLKHLRKFENKLQQPLGAAEEDIMSVELPPSKKHGDF